MNQFTTDRPRPVTMRDIAERCGVTTATVSLALRHDRRLSAATTARVQAVAEELGYDISHNHAARRMVMRRYGREVTNRVLAAFFPPAFYKAAFYTRIQEGMLDATTAEGFTLAVSIDAPASSSALLPPIFGNGEVDGALVCCPQSDMPQRIRKLAGYGNRPIVSLIYDIPNGEYPHVTMDNEQGGYLAGKHLLELGHRHLLHFYSAGLGPVIHERYLGLCRAVREAGLDPERHLYLADWHLGNLQPSKHLVLPETAIEGDHIDYTAEQEKFLNFMREHPQITAVLATNDSTARRVWYLLQRAGYALPQDVSVVGFDDTDPVLDNHGRNLLTSVQVPLVDLGRAAAEMIIQHTLQQTPITQRVVLPTTLAVRGSTAPAKG